MVRYSKECLEERSQFACKIIFLAFVLIGLLLVILLHLEVFPNVQDSRCKCVCPHNLNATSNRTVFLGNVNSSRECVCRNMVPLWDDKLCLMCNCNFETRNKLLIKVVIVSMMITIFTLVIATIMSFIKKFVISRLKRDRDYQLIDEPLNINSASTAQYQKKFHDRIARERRQGYL